MRQQRHSKPPKLRFRPGQFFRLKETIAPGKEKGQLYCVVQVYRTTDSPHVWLFSLEERSLVGHVSTAMSAMCEAVVGGFLSPDSSERITWQPVRGGMLPSMGDRDYGHGDRIIATNQEMLGKFERC